MEEFGLNHHTLSKEKEIRVVLYGDLGSAIADELPKDSLSEGLYAMNLNLAKKLQSEHSKVEKRNAEVLAMSAHLENLVTMVDTFQSRFEDHLTEIKNTISSKTASIPEHAGGAESGFGDASTLDPDTASIDDEHIPSSSHSTNIQTAMSTNSHIVHSTESKLALQLREIVLDLHKVVGDISAREAKWTDDQKSLSGSQKEAVISDFRHDVMERIGHRLNGSLESIEREKGKKSKKSHISHSEEMEDRDFHTPALDKPNGQVAPDEHEILEGRYHSIIKRLQNSHQEKLLLESTVEKLKDELELAQFEKESLLKKNERTLMSLNSVLSEKSAVEAALSTVSADLENASSIRWALEGSSVVLRESLAGLTAQKEALEVANSRLVEEKSALKQTISEYEVKMTTLSEEMEYLRKESETVNTELRHRRMDSGKLYILQEELSRATLEINKLRTRMTQLSTESEELFLLKEKLLDAEKDLIALQQTLDGKDFMIQRIESSLAQEQTKSRNLHDQLTEKENFLLDQQTKIDKLEKSIVTLDTTISQLSQSQLDLQMESEQRRLDNYDMKRNNTILHEELTLKSEQIIQFQSTIEERDEHIISLTDKISSMENVLTELTQANEAIQRLKRDIEDALELSRRTVDGKNVKIDQLEQELQERLKWLQENQREIDTIRSELVHVTKENKQLREEVSERLAELRQTETRVAQLQGKLDGASQLQDSVSQLQQENSALSKQLIRLQDENTTFASRINDLNQELQLNSHKFNQTTKELSAIQDDLENSQSLLSVSDDRLRQSEEANEQLREACDVLKKEKSTLEEYSKTYAEIIHLFGAAGAFPYQVRLDRDSLLHSPDSMEERHGSIAIFTPDGVIYRPDDEEANQDDLKIPQRASPFDENDSGFVGSTISNGPEESRQLDQKRTYPAVIAHDLVTKLEHKRDDVPFSIRSHTTTLINSARQAENVFRELEESRIASLALQRTVYDLTKNLDKEYAQREKLAEERDDLKEQVDKFLNEIRNLKKCLDYAEADKRTMERDVENREINSAELKSLLKNAEKEIDILKSNYSTASNTIRELNDNHNALLQQKEIEVETLRIELKKNEMLLDDANKRNGRNEEKLKDLLTKINESDLIVSELTSQLRDAENQAANVDYLNAKSEALQALEQTLDVRIAQIQDREDAVRRLEQQVANFVTDQLALTNRELEVNEKAQSLKVRENSLMQLEDEFNNKLCDMRKTEDSFRQRETELICLAEERERSALQKAASDHQIANDDLCRQLKTSECRVDDLTRACTDANSELARYKNECQQIQCENEELKRKMDYTMQRSIPREHHETEICRLKNALDERSNQLASMCAEQDKLKLKLQNSTEELHSMKRTSDGLEQRLQDKIQGQGTMEDRFNTINTLYADSLCKYRTLSEAYDDLEIKMVRNKDEYRDAKRELDKLTYSVRRHLDGSGSRAPSRSATEENEENDCTTITKNMIVNLRASVEQLLEDRNRQSRQIDSLVNSQNGPSISGNQLLSPVRERRTPNRSARKEPYSSDLSNFREQVMTRLFEDSSRRTIALEEALMDSKPRSPVFGATAGDYDTPRSLSKSRKRAEDPLRRQAAPGSDDSDGCRLQTPH